MILLLDENIPRKIRYRFTRHTVRTVHEMGWAGYRNGRLLQAMGERGLPALLTVDRNLPFQQHVDRLTVAVFVLRAPNNRYESLLPYVPEVERRLDRGPSPGIYLLA